MRRGEQDVKFVLLIVAPLLSFVVRCVSTRAPEPQAFVYNLRISGLQHNDVS